MGIYPIDHPIWNSQNEYNSDDSNEDLVGMYGFYAQSDNESSDDEPKTIIQDGVIQVPSQIKQEKETYEVSYAENKSDKINDSDRNTNVQHHNYNDDESDSEYESGDDLSWCRNNGDDDRIHEYLEENFSDEEESDDESLDQDPNKDLPDVKTGQKYYAVANGRQVGIYNSWAVQFRLW